MRVQVHNKLVRDKIPQILEEKGVSCAVITLTQELYEQCLVNKLLEEASEYVDSNEVEELADLMEVILALLDIKGLTFDDLEKIRLEKREARGGFIRKLFLSKTVEGED